MLAVLCSGSLIRDPQQRQGANGPAYVTALMRCPAEDSDPLLISLIAFSDTAVAALLALGQGDALSVAGRAKLREWQQGEETKHGVSVTADQVLTVYAAGKKRKAAQPDEVHG